jgi:hypothetical protein
MEVNPLRRVLTAKATTFVGLALLVALVMMVIASMDSVGQAGAKTKPHKKSQFGAKEVIDTNGALPLDGTYNKRGGGTLLISAAGSGWSSNKDQLIGMKVYVDNNRVGTAQVWTNEAASHKAFVPVFAVVNNVSKGPHTIKLEPLNPATKTDQNDYFRVTVEEQPRG